MTVKPFLSNVKDRVKESLLVVVLLILSLAFFWKMALTNLILVGLDVFTYFYPYRAYAAEALRRGRIPLWNPYLFLGVPFLANPQAAVFYPLHWPLSFLPAPGIVSYSIVMHVFLAALFTYLYARLSVGLGRFGAFLGAIVFALGGFLGAQVEHVNQLNVFAWMPLAFLLFDLAAGRQTRNQGTDFTDFEVRPGSKASLRGRVGYVLLGGLVVGLQFTAGHTQAVYICLFALGVYALVGAWQRRTLAIGRARGLALRAVIRRLLTYALMVAIGVALAAVQLLPTYELSKRSMRSGGLSYREAVSFSLRPHLLFYSLLPAFGEDLSQVFGESFGEYVGYVGCLALGLAVVGAVLGRKGRASFILLSFLGLFLAFGAYNPFYFAFYKLVPGFAFFRAPVRWLFIYAFGLAMLAGLGGEVLVGPDFRERGRNLADDLRGIVRRHKTLPWLMVILAALLIVLAAITMDFPGWRAWALWGGLALVMISLLYRAMTSRAKGFHFRLLLTILVVYELLVAGQPLAYNQPTAPEAFSFLRPAPAYLLTKPGLHRFLSMSGITYDPGDLRDIEQIFEGQLPPKAIYDYVVSVKQKEILAPNLPLLYRLFSVDGYDGGVLPLRRYVDLQRLFLAEDELSPDGRLREQLKEVPEARLLALLNVKYVITDKVYDVWIDDVFYDLEFTARLEPGDEVIVADADLPPFTTTSLGLVSYLAGCAHLADGTPVAEVTVTDHQGQTQRHVLRAGQDTAEGQYTEAVRHSQARVGLQRRDEDGQDKPGGRNYYITVLDLGAALVPRRMAVKYLAEEGELRIRGLSLIDGRTGTSRSVIVSTSGRFRLVHSGDVKIYENLDALPRAFIVHRARVIEDDWQAVAAMKEETFQPDREVILAASQNLEGDNDLEINADSSRESLEINFQAESSSALKRTLDRFQTASFSLLQLSAWEFDSQAEVISYEPERVVVSADLAREGYLILTDSHYPDWRALVDGRPTPIQRADVLFRAVYLSPGSHLVEFVYDPASFKIGAVVSLLTLLAVAGGLLWWMRGER